MESLLGSEDGNNNSLANVLRDTESNIIGKFSIVRNKAIKYLLKVHVKVLSIENSLVT